MEKNFLTAQEANKKAKDYSGIDIICRRIEDAAAGGCLKTSFLNILPQDKTKLEMLGFTVAENPNDKFPYTVSWE